MAAKKKRPADDPADDGQEPQEPQAEPAAKKTKADPSGAAPMQVSAAAGAGAMNDFEAGAAVPSCSEKLVISMWNVANLGGGFGYKAKRDDDVIEEIANTVKQIGAHITIILEVLDHSRAIPQRERLKDFVGLGIRLSRPLRGFTSVSLLRAFSAELRVLLADHGQPIPENSSEAEALVELQGLWTSYAQRLLAAPNGEDLAIRLDACGGYIGGMVADRLGSAAIVDFAQALFTAMRGDTVASFKDNVAIADQQSAAADAGFLELQRIHQQLPQPRYGLFVPNNGQKVVYTAGETYGLFFDSEVVGFAGADYIPNFKGRQPLLAWFTLKHLPGERIGVIAWHPPSDSAANVGKRTDDFPEFAKACRRLRAAYPNDIFVLGFDSNIDTSLGARYVRNCDVEIPVLNFYDVVTGDYGWLERSMFRDALTSLRKSRLEHQLAQLLTNRLPLHLAAKIESYVQGDDANKLYNAFDKLAVLQKRSNAREVEVEQEWVHNLLSRYPQDQALAQARRLSDHQPVAVALKLKKRAEQPVAMEP